MLAHRHLKRRELNRSQNTATKSSGARNGSWLLRHSRDRPQRLQCRNWSVPVKTIIIIIIFVVITVIFTSGARIYNSSCLFFASRPTFHFICPKMRYADTALSASVVFASNKRQQRQHQLTALRARTTGWPKQNLTSGRCTGAK